MAKKRKVHSLTGRIDDRLMMQAFKAVKKNRGAAGGTGIGNNDRSRPRSERARRRRLQVTREGYEFLGFRLSSKSRTMRPKSLEKFQTKIRELTRRSHNLDARAIERLNQVIRGTANYFATNFSTCVKLFQKLDKWIRMRIRCMKFKRRSTNDNYRLRQGSFDKKLVLLKLLSFTNSTMCKT